MLAYVNKGVDAQCWMIISDIYISIELHMIRFPTVLNFFL
jgi:hypothetical protein